MQIHVASTTAADRACAHIRAQVAAGRALVVRIDEPKRLRSLKANARYWILVTLISDHVRPQGQVYEKDIWHHWLKRRFMKPAEYTLPSGKVVQEWPSTSDMPHEDFLAYMTQVEAWAAERGVIMPDHE